MALLFYSVMGEGRGHAARAKAVVERLRSHHRIVLFTSHDALSFLRNEYREDREVDVRQIPGLVFHYTEKRLDNIKTVREGIGFYLSLSRLTRPLESAIRAEQPDLVITDFEPLMPRAARRVGVPVLSLDHQHFLTTYDLRSLTPELRRWAWRMGWSVWAFGIEPQRHVVSAFYKPPLRAGFEGVTQVGPLLRRAVATKAATRGEHMLCYFRRATPQRVVDLIANQSLPARVYGLGERPRQGSATFCKIDERTFVDDLASCDSVISAAGNQLMGEAFHFEKPVLALPERRHYEQRINASFVEQMRGGEQRILEKLGAADLAGFLGRRETYRNHLASTKPCEDGGPEVERVIHEMITAAGDGDHLVRESA